MEMAQLPAAKLISAGRPADWLAGWLAGLLGELRPTGLARQL